MEDNPRICGDEEFYEKIEAPKFVDFTTPDRFRPDDRFWFCLRVGCDRKHEEEIDHEAISKDFVLRVMAARSPNVGFRKALKRNTNSIKDRCPLSAPAKPTKSRLSKLAVISSVSQKAADAKAKTKPISKLTSTPKLPKTKQVAAKYLTTPSHKICPPNTNKSFRTVQNSKPTNIAVPKTKIVAKALFKPPKKGICVKTSAELRTPLTKICQGMKKLSITSQRKRVLGYSSKSMKEIKRKSICKDKSKTSSMLRISKSKEQKTKSLRGLKRKSKEDETLRNGVVDNELGDMEIDTKSRNNDGYNANTALADPEEKSIVKFEEIKEEIDEKSRICEGNNTDTALADAKERSIAAFKEANEISQVNLKERTEASLGEVSDEDEEIENDDKENDSAPDYNNRSCGRNTLRRLEGKTNRKVVKTQDRNLKEGLKAAATGAQVVVKYKKPKPTNPKPFRLRTDERGILREANMEKKARPKENDVVLTLLITGGLDKKNGNEIEKQTRPAERSEGDRKLMAKVPNTTNPQRRPNLTKQLENEREILGEISEKSTRKTKSPSMQPHFMMPIGGASTRKTIASDVKTGDKLIQKKRSTTVAKETHFQSVQVQKSCTRKVT